jgi:hypothetical protein
MNLNGVFRMNIIYWAILLDDKSKEKLLKEYPAVHPNVKAEHVTLLYGGEAKNSFPANNGSIAVIEVTAYGLDEMAQGVMVKWADKTSQLDNKSFLHITISFADGSSAVATNNIKNWVKVSGLKLSGKVAVYTSEGWK